MTTFREFVKKTFGLLSYGAHHTDHSCACILEAVSQYKGLEWTDAPFKLDFPDLRDFNDADWPSDEERTEAMFLLYDRLHDWCEWTEEKQLEYCDQVAAKSNWGRLFYSDQADVRLKQLSLYGYGLPVEQLQNFLRCWLNVEEIYND